MTSSTTTDLVVYGGLGSPFVRKVLVVLEEKGLPWTLEEVNVFDPPEWFLELSPAKRIPVLRDRSIASDGVAGTLADSSAICGYLEQKFPEPALYPTDAYDYGRALWLEEWADTLLAVRIGFGFLRTLMVTRQMGQEPDLERARKTYHQDLPPLFDYLEGVLGNREFAIGESFSIADIALATQLSGMRITRVPMDATRWPGVASYADRILSRPSFASRLEELVPIMPDEAFVP
jgi:glutathione S-transferase